jgi:hypothetical protein
MATRWIVERINVVRYLGLCKLASPVDLLLDAFLFEAAEEGFHNCVVPAVAATAYARFKIICLAEPPATSVTDITTMYFGEKVCRILDPFGNLWWLNQRIEEIEPAEIKRRAATPEATKGIAYIQKSLDEALRAQKAFFAEAA